MVLEIGQFYLRKSRSIFRVIKKSETGWLLLRNIRHESKGKPYTYQSEGYETNMRKGTIRIGTEEILELLSNR